MSSEQKQYDDDTKAEAGKSSSIVFIAVWIYVWFFQYDLPLVSLWTPLFVFGGMFVVSFTLAPIRYILAGALVRTFIRQGSDGGVVFRPGLVPISLLFKVLFFAFELAACYYGLHFFIGMAGF